MVPEGCASYAVPDKSKCILKIGNVYVAPSNI
jgi:hypothetical protein